MHNYKKIDLSKLSDVEIYKLLLEGKIATFPSGFWVSRSKEEGKEVSIKLLRYLIINRMKFNKEDMKLTISKKFITQSKLHTPCKLYHGRSAIQFVLNAFPELELTPWQFKKDKVPYGYWKSEKNRVSALTSFIKEQMVWDIEEAKQRLSWDLLEENGLGSLHSYYPSLYKILKAVYKDNIYPWELVNGEVSPGTWEDRENRITAIKWLLKKLNYKIDNINRKTFAKYGLSTLLAKYYGDNAKRAIREVINTESYDKSGAQLKVI